MAEELLTAKKIADKIGVPVKDVSTFITSSKIDPDQVKGGCKYYGPVTLKKIEKGLKK